MKVYLGPYTTWIGPYQIAGKLCAFFGRQDLVYNFGKWLAENKNGNESLLLKFCLWFDKRKKRKIKVQIHDYDTWNTSQTLAVIILPLLKQVKKKKIGSPFVDDEDVPKELRSTEAPKKKREWDVDANWHKRWEWVLDEMIWTFEQLHPDSNWEDQFYSDEQEEGSKIGYSCDLEGLREYEKRIIRGTTLFGKYFQNISD